MRTWLLTSLLVCGSISVADAQAPTWPEATRMDVRIGPRIAAAPTSLAGLRQRQREQSVQIRWPAAKGAQAYRLTIGDTYHDLEAHITSWSGEVEGGGLIELVAFGPDGQSSTVITVNLPEPRQLPVSARGAIGGPGGGGIVMGRTVVDSRAVAGRVPTASVKVTPGGGGLTEPLLRPTIFQLREALARCRPHAAPPQAPRRVAMEAMVEPGGRARAWMIAPDKRHVTAPAWAAAQPVGECLAKLMSETRWARPIGGMPGGFVLEMNWPDPQRRRR